MPSNSNCAIVVFRLMVYSILSFTSLTCTQKRLFWEVGICLLPTNRLRKRHWNYGPLFQLKVQCRTGCFVNNDHFFQECHHGVLGGVAAWTAATWMGFVSQGFAMHPQNGISLQRLLGIALFLGLTELDQGATRDRSP